MREGKNEYPLVPYADFVTKIEVLGLTASCHCGVDSRRRDMKMVLHKLLVDATRIHPSLSR